MKMIRKSLAIMLTLCLSLTACVSESDPTPVTPSNPAPVSTPVSPSASEPPSIPASSSVSEPASTLEPPSAPASSSPAEEDGAGRNSALDNVPLMDIPSWFESSIWEFDGGMVDNKEMNDAEGQQILDELFSGRLVISVNPASATMVFGTGDSAAMLPGNWKANGSQVSMGFPDVGDFTARLTDVTGKPVMMLAIEENITFYLIPLPTIDIPSAIGGMQITTVPDLYQDDTWLFTGALEDGQKLGLIETQGVLDQLFRGNMQLAFRDVGRADLIYSTENIVAPGVWQLQGNVLGFGFYPDSGEPIYYTGCFSQEDGIPVLLLILDEQKVIYLTLLPRTAG